jgi:hypothetical protein
MQREVPAARTKVLGAEHPSLSRQGEYAEAEKTQRSEEAGAGSRASHHVDHRGQSG